MNYILFVAFKMLFESRRQTLVSVLGVSVGVCAFIVMSFLLLSTSLIIFAINKGGEKYAVVEEKEIKRLVYGSGYARS